MAPLKAFVNQHPNLSAWMALALGMVVLLLIAVQHVGLLPGQVLALVVVTILLAGLCVWIISLE
jgi:predicted tellurium resistance membrane protein TerC